MDQTRHNANAGGQPGLASLLGRLDGQARARLGTAKRWAQAANVSQETLSRLKKRKDCDLSTLERLALPINLRLALQPVLPKEMPTQYGRAEEEGLLGLCASSTLDLRAWFRAGSRYFMAGLATMLANGPEMDRATLLALAEALYPGMSTVQVFDGWLKSSPLRPSRFLPMLRKRLTPDSAVLAAPARMGATHE